MIGAFGGALGDVAAGDVEARETVPASLADLLAPDDAPAAGSAHERLVPIRGVRGAGRLVYAGDLRGRAPLVASPEGEVAGPISSLREAVPALRALHAAGRAHGDLRPAHLWTGPGGTRLSWVVKPLDGGALLRARLREGGDLLDVGFVAPEVLAGRPANPASDVYSLAAIACWVATGRPPLGWTSSRPFGRVVERALSPEPDRRPSLEELDAALGAVVAAPATAPQVRLVAAPGAPAGSALGARAAPDRQGTSLILVALLLVGAVFTLAGAFWLVAVSWDTIGKVGQLTLLVLLTAGAYLGGRKLEGRSYARTGFALVALSTQLLWADGAYVLSVAELGVDDALSWCVLSSAVTAVTFALALQRESALLSVLATGGGTVATLTLGSWLSTGSHEGPAIWCLVCGAALAGMAALGRARAGDRVGLPPALGTACFLVASWVLGLALFGRSGQEHVVFATLWPYGLAVLALGAGAGLARVPSPLYRGVALVVGCAFVAFTPTIGALAQESNLGFLHGASLAGTAIVVAAFRAPRLAADQAAQLLTVLAGLVSVTVAPGILAIAKLATRSGDDLLVATLRMTPAERLESPLFYLPYAVVTASVLVALGLLFARDAERKLPYRLLELAGILLFFGVLTLLSLVNWRDFLYPGVLFGGGLALLGLGAWLRHVLLVLVPAAFLILNAWIQYFAKLSMAEIHLGLLLIGFGMGLLVGGAWFERRIRPKLKGLSDWA